MIIIIAICLCLIAFGWLLPLLIIPALIGLLLFTLSMLLSAGAYHLWRKLWS